MKKLIVFSAIITVCVLVFQCGIINTGNSSEVDNPSVVGTLYQPDGETPAEKAMVILRPNTILAMVGDIASRHKDSYVDTVLTNNHGQYSFDNTQTGIVYSIEAKKDNNAIFIESVNVNEGDASVDVGVDTLKPTGVIRGTIHLAGGGLFQNVYVLAFGIDRFVNVQNGGSFLFNGLGEGEYDLRIIAALQNYGIANKPRVIVTAGDTTDVGQIELPYTGIAAPSNVTVPVPSTKVPPELVQFPAILMLKLSQSRVLPLVIPKLPLKIRSASWVFVPAESIVKL